MRLTPRLLQQAGKAGEAAKHAMGQDKGSIVPLVVITGVTAASMAVWWKRKAAQDPELRSPDTRAAGMPAQAPGGVEQGYGRKSADATGMMEGDRAMQGIFPTKKTVGALEGVLPERKGDDK